MSKVINNGPEVGKGIFTLPDIAKILNIPNHRVRRWISEYWDTKLSTDFDGTYSWTDGKNKAVSFYTLIEIYVFIHLKDSGVSTRKLVDVHSKLSKIFNTPFPFATSKIVSNIKTDGKNVYFDEDGAILTIDKSYQYNLNFIIEFFKRIDFGKNELAERLWPMGKDRSIIIDPSHRFGQAVIVGTNINPSSLYDMHNGGEPIEFIASIYDLENNQVKDAIEFCKTAA